MDNYIAGLSEEDQWYTMLENYLEAKQNSKKLNTLSITSIPVEDKVNVFFIGCYMHWRLGYFILFFNFICGTQLYITIKEVDLEKYKHVFQNNYLTKLLNKI